MHPNPLHQVKLAKDGQFSRCSIRIERKPGEGMRTVQTSRATISQWAKRLLQLEFSGQRADSRFGNDPYVPVPSRRKPGLHR